MICQTRRDGPWRAWAQRIDCSRKHKPPETHKVDESPAISDASLRQRLGTLLDANRAYATASNARHDSAPKPLLRPADLKLAHEHQLNTTHTLVRAWEQRDPKAGESGLM